MELIQGFPLYKEFLVAIFFIQFSQSVAFASHSASLLPVTTSSIFEESPIPAYAQATCFGLRTWDTGLCHHRTLAIVMGWEMNPWPHRAWDVMKCLLQPLGRWSDTGLHVLALFPVTLRADFPWLLNLTSSDVTLVAQNQPQCKYLPQTSYFPPDIQLASSTPLAWGLLLHEAWDPNHNVESGAKR